MVEVVGARPTEQASGAGGRTIAMSDWRSSVESGLPATPISGMREAAGVGDEVGELGGLAGVREQQHHVVGGDHAEVAVAGLGRVDEERRRAGGGEGGGDLAGDVAGLAHARDDHPAAGGEHPRHRRGEARPERGGEAGEAVGLDARSPGGRWR